MENLLTCMPQILRATGNSREVIEAAAVAAWKHVAGDGLRGHAIPLRMEGKVLVVAVADLIWQKQLGAMRGQLLFRINAILGQPFVSQIDLRVDPKLVVERLPPRKQAEDWTSNEVPLDLWAAASEIHDKELRRTFLKAAMTALKKLNTQAE